MSYQDPSIRNRIERLESLIQKVSGAGGGGVATGVEWIIAANEAAASAVAGLADGQPVFILSHRSIWFSDPNSTLPLKPNEVIARAGGGRLWRTDYSDPEWRIGITDIYIDPSNSTGIANDENKGIHEAPQVGAARAPLLTWRELYRRMGRGNLVSTGDPIGLTIQVHVLSNEPSLSDTAIIDWLCDTDTFPRILGEAPVVVLAGVLDAIGGFTVQNPAVPAPGGTDAKIKVGATVWGPFLGKRIRFTASGAVATILKDLGGGTARVSQPVITNEPFFAFIPTAFNPPNGAAFVVEDLTTMAPDDWQFSFTGSALGFLGQMNVADITFLNVGIWGPKSDRLDDNAIIVFYQCGFDLALTAEQRISSVGFSGCSLRNNIAFGSAAFMGCGIRSTAPLPFFAATAARTQFLNTLSVLDSSTYVQGTPVIADGPCQLGGLFAVWDVPIVAGSTQVDPGGHAIQIGSIAGMPASATFRGGPVFGSGSVGVGVRVAAGANLNYATLPNITGGGGDAKLGDSTVGWAWNPATGVYNPVGAGIGLSWAAIATAIGLGGFGGSAHDPAQDAHIVKAAAT